MEWLFDEMSYFIMFGYVVVAVDCIACYIVVYVSFTEICHVVVLYSVSCRELCSLYEVNVILLQQ